MLNKIDLKIISALQENGRAGYAQLAQKLGISSSTVARRLDSLLESGVLIIQAVPNPYKVRLPAAAFICMNVSLDTIDSVCARFKSIFNVNLVSTTFGRFNLLISIYYPSWDMLHSFISSEISGRSDITSTEIFFIKEIMKPHQLDLNKYYTEQQPVEIDEIDQQIMELLACNGRLSGLHLANQLNISTSSVSKRLARLFEEDVIRARVQVDPSKLGYHSNAFIVLRAERGKVDTVCNLLAQLKEVITIMTLANGYDIYIATVTRNAHDLYDFIKKYMAPASGVIGLETLISGEVIKRYHGVLDLELDRVGRYSMVPLNITPKTGF